MLLPTMFAAFMFSLDETIANIALPHIAGSFSVSSQESIWILTSYLIASCLTIPMLDWLGYENDSYSTDYLLKSKLDKPATNEKYNYISPSSIPIKLIIDTPIKSEKEVYEGQIIEFKNIEAVVLNTKIIVPKNTICTARVETIIQSGMNGLPASIILGNFNIPNIDNHKLTMSYEKYGFDLSLLEFPIKWLLTPLPPTGLLTNFIKGGHVKINKNKPIIIEYFYIDTTY